MLKYKTTAAPSDKFIDDAPNVNVSDISGYAPSYGTGGYRQFYPDGNFDMQHCRTDDGLCEFMVTVTRSDTDDTMNIMVVKGDHATITALVKAEVDHFN